MGEMLDDIQDMDEDDELDEEADEEVDKVLFELTDGKLGEAGSVSTQVPVSHSSCSLFTQGLTTATVIGRCAGRRRDGEKYGKVPTATKWASQWVMCAEHLVYTAFAIVIRIEHCTVVAMSVEA